MILRAVAIGAILASAGPARAQSSSGAGTTPLPRVMLSALLHTDSLSAQLLVRVRSYIAASKAVSLVPERDVITTSIADHPSPPTLDDIREIAWLVRANVVVEVSAEPRPSGVEGVALLGTFDLKRRLLVDTLRTRGAWPLDSVAKALAERVLSRADRHVRP
jgi:hypothetical protein